MPLLAFRGAPMMSDVRDAWYYAFTSLSEAEVEAVHLEGASATALKDFVTRAVERNKALYDDRHVRIGVNLSGAEGVTSLDECLSTGVYDVAGPTNVVYTTLGSTEEFERVLDKSPKDVALMKQCITAYLMRWRLAAKRFLKTPSLFAGPEIAETLGCWFYQPGMPWLLAESPTCSMRSATAIGRASGTSESRCRSRIASRAPFVARCTRRSARQS
jgi:hypothetical protein